MSDYDLPVAGAAIRGPDKFASQGGAYHAARSTSGRSRQHEGIDLVCEAGSVVTAPMPCWYERHADPYDDKRDAVLLGCVLRLADDRKIKILYIKPAPHVKPGLLLKRGDIVGYSQSLQHLYPGITDHVHVELYSSGGERIDPTAYFFPPSVATT